MLSQCPPNGLECLKHNTEQNDLLKWGAVLSLMKSYQVILRLATCKRPVEYEKVKPTICYKSESRKNALPRPGLASEEIIHECPREPFPGCRE